MPTAKLRITVPEDVWIGRLSRSFPDATLRVLAALADDETGVGLVEVTAPDAAAVPDAIAGEDAVTDAEVFYREDDEALVQFETASPLLLLPVQDSGVPLELPFAIRDGEATWEVTAPRDRLSELASQLEAFGVRFDVEWVRESVEAGQLLTDRQRELLVAAVEAGYYDTPRRCSLTELADAVGIAKSTCSETLHRAESRVVKHHLRSLASAREEPSLTSA